MNNLKLTAVALAAAFGLNSAVAQDATLPAASTKKDLTFATDIKPIFDAACIKCHGDTKPRAGVVLTTLEATLKGGTEGKILTPGEGSKGSLINAVAHIGDPGTFMPKGQGAKKLSDEQIGLIRAWIDQGAK
jgi:mono/diheme cytochrome c family protein